MTRTIHADELKTRLIAGDVVVIDVRREADYRADAQAIPGAVWRRPDDVAQWSAALPRDKDIVIYCVRGGSVTTTSTTGS